jgi:hypothetical protein
MLKYKIYRYIYQARVSFVSLKIKDKKEKKPHAFVSYTSHKPQCTTLHGHRLHKRIHRIATLLQSRRDELLSQDIESVAFSETVENIQPIEPFLDHPLLRRLLQDLASVAYDEQSRRATAFFFHGRCDVLQRSADHALVGAGSALDDCAGCRRGIGGGFVARQAVAEEFESVESHEEDNSLVGEVVWRIGRSAFASSTSADQHLVAHGAMRDGDPREQGSAKRAGDAREDRGDVAVLAEEGEFFGAAAVEVGVTLLEAEDGLALLHGTEAHFEELLLCCVCVAGEFAGDFDWCSARDEFKDAGGDEFVCQDEVGTPNSFESRCCEEIGVSRTRAC